MDPLPIWIAWGPALGALVVALGGGLGLVGVRRRRRRFAERLGEARALLGVESDDLDPDADRATLRGVLRAPEGGSRLERPEDGAPVVAATAVEAAGPGPESGPPWIGGDVAPRPLAAGAWLELRDGRRVELVGPASLVVGAREQARPRPAHRYPDEVRARAAESLRRVQTELPVAFRSIPEGAPVIVEGALERVAGETDGGYRGDAARHRLVGDDARPLTIAYAARPSLRGEAPGPELMATLGGALAAAALRSGVAEATVDARDPYDARTAQVQTDHSVHRYVPPFDRPPAPYLAGVMSPAHRDDALRSLARRYAFVAPFGEREREAYLEAQRLRSCREHVSGLLRFGRYESVLALAPACADASTGDEVTAALALGRLDRLVALAETHRAELPPMMRASIHAMARRWADAAEAVREEARRYAQWSEDADEGAREYSEGRHARTSCLAASFERRATGEGEPAPGSLDRSFCRAAWADALPPDERADLLQDASDPQGGWILALLAAELGQTPDARPPVLDVFELFELGIPLRFSGLHASARRALAERGGAPRLLARLRAGAAVFNVLRGDLERAAGFAWLVLREVNRAASAAERVAVTVRIWRAVVEGDLDAADRVLALRSSAPWAEPLQRRVDLYAGRDAAPVEGDDAWRVRTDRALAAAARDDDPERFAAVLHGERRRLHRGAVLHLPLLDGAPPVVVEQLRAMERPVYWSALEPRRALRYWSVELWLARLVGDDAAERRARRLVDRFAAMVLRRDTAVPMTLLAEL